MTQQSKTRLAFLTIIFLILLRFIALSFPSLRLWGVDQLRYLPLSLSIIIIVCIILFWLLFAFPDKTGIALIIKKLSRITKGIPQSISIIVGIAVLAALFYFLRDRINLLGDGLLRIQQMKNIGLARVFADTPSEALDYIIHWLTYAYVLKPYGLDTLASFQLWSILAGLAYVWTSWQIAVKLRRESIESWLTFAWLLGWGGMVMFFGYAEEYTLAAIFQLLVFNFAIDYARSGKNLTLLLVAFLIGFFLHNLNLILLPAICYLVLTKSRSPKTKYIVILSIVAAIVIGYLGWSRLGNESGSFLLFDSKSEPGYNLFGGAHIMDIINQLLLISPGFLALIWFVKFGGDGQPDKRKLRVFFWLAAIAGLAALILIDPKLGLPRDWDLFSLPLLAFHTTIFLGVDWRKIARPFKIGVVVASIGLTFAWIVLNSNQGWALARFRQNADLDYLRAGYNYEALGDYYNNLQRYAESEEALTLSVARRPHIRCYIRLGYAQSMQKKYALAEKSFLEGLKYYSQVDSESVFATTFKPQLQCYFLMGFAQMMQNKNNLAEKSFLEALKIDPHKADALKCLANIAYTDKRYRDSRMYYDRYRQTPEGKLDPELPAVIALLDSLNIQRPDSISY